MISPVRQWWRSVLKVVYAKFASPSSPFTLSPPFPLPTLPSLKSRPPLIQLEFVVCSLVKIHAGTHAQNSPAYNKSLEYDMILCI